MKKFIFVPAFIAVLASGCNNGPVAQNNTVNTPSKADTAKKEVVVAPVRVVPPDLKKEKAVVARYLRKLESPVQPIVTTGKNPSVVKGLKGTYIMVNPKDMITDEGQPVVEDIHVELREVTSGEDFVKENAPTVSDGRLLVSGGAYYINMTSEGRQLSMKPGRSLKINLPKLTGQDMTLFYGQRDSTGRMNWKESAQKLVNYPTDSSSRIFQNRMNGGGRQNDTGSFELGDLKTGTMSAYDFRKLISDDTFPAPKKTAGQKQLETRFQAIASTVYNEIQVQNFGWINCDHFLESQNLTNIAYNFELKDSIVYARTYLIFRDINSVMDGYYLYTMPARFYNLPVGSKATLVALAVKKGQVYSSRSEIVVGKNMAVTLPMKKTSDKDVAALFKPAVKPF